MVKCGLLIIAFWLFGCSSQRADAENQALSQSVNSVFSAESILRFEKAFDSIYRDWKLDSVAAGRCPFYAEYESAAKSIGQKNTTQCYKSAVKRNVYFIVSRHYSGKQECLAYLTVLDRKGFALYDKEFGEDCRNPINGP